MSQYPLLFRVRQSFDAKRVENIPVTVENELRRLEFGDKIKAGQTVAITAGSRGVANIAVIIKAAVDHFKSLGAKPFIVPAMGSHGGGTAEGQRELIEGYGITEAAMGCPIRASMETVVVCQAARASPFTSTSTPSGLTTCWSSAGSSRTPASSAISNRG